MCASGTSRSPPPCQSVTGISSSARVEAPRPPADEVVVDHRLRARLAPEAERSEAERGRARGRVAVSRTEPAATLYLRLGLAPGPSGGPSGLTAARPTRRSASAQPQASAYGAPADTPTTEKRPYPRMLISSPRSRAMVGDGAVRARVRPGESGTVDHQVADAELARSRRRDPVCANEASRSRRDSRPRGSRLRTGGHERDPAPVPQANDTSTPDVHGRHLAQCPCKAA